MPRKAPTPTTPTAAARPALTRYDLYRACVQDPPRMVRFIEAVHDHMQIGTSGRQRATPLVLREDFAGPASLSAAWIDRGPRRRAVAVDRDPEPLSHARVDPRLSTRTADVRRCRDQADCVALFNFAICELHDRAALRGYLSHLRRTVLKPGGVVIMDLFGGVGTLAPNDVRAARHLPDRTRIDYTWRVDAVAPLAGMINCSLHFALPASVTKRGWQTKWPNAFTYHWRLWTPAELRDALGEAGFTRIEAFDRLGDATDSQGRLYVQPLAVGDQLDDDWVLYLAAGA